MKRTTLVVIHRYVAWTCGIFIALIALSGALLLLDSLLADRLHPQRVVAMQEGARPSFSLVLATAAKAVPDAPGWTIDVPDEPGRAYEVLIPDPERRRLLVDPYTGKLLENRADNASLAALLLEFHTHFLSGESGKYINAFFGASLLFLTVTGLFLWRPRKWSTAFRVRLDAGRMGLFYDFHRALGALAATFFLISGVTGLVLIFSLPAARLVAAIAGHPLASPPARSASPRPVAPESLDSIVAAAETAYPAAKVARVVLDNDGSAVQVRMRRADEDHPYGLNRVYIDPATFEVLQLTELRTASPGARMFDWLYPMHIGTLFGSGHRIALALAGLAPTLLLISALMVWALRRARQRRALSATKAQ